LAIARESKDLWAAVQKQVWPGGGWSNNVRPLPAPILHVPDEETWHASSYQAKADGILASLEQALVAGRNRKARRLRSQWLHQYHLDRLSCARQVARERGLRLDPVGRGPIVDQPTVHYRDHLPWYLTPVSRYSDGRLPHRATSVVETWNGSGGVFDGLYMADQPVSSGHFPIHSLIGAISPDGRTADWFVLDRWAA
jgi:hypothetical protein